MVFIWKGWLVIAPSGDWTVGGTTHRGSCLIAIREDAFLEGERSFLPLFTPSDKMSLTGFETGKEWAAINYSDDLLTRTRFANCRSRDIAKRRSSSSTACATTRCS